MRSYCQQARKSGLELLGHRYYDSGTGRFINRDPTSYDGGPDLYEYADDNPATKVDPSGDAPRLAYMYVGDTSIGWWIDWSYAKSIKADIANLTTFFQERGYTVKVYPAATADRITSTLGNASAAAFIGHNDNANTSSGGYGVDDNVNQPSFETANGVSLSEDDFITALNRGKDMLAWQAAIKGRHLQYAIFHSCQTDNSQLRGIFTGSKGYFYGAHGDWNAMFNVDSGLGLKKLHYPRPYTSVDAP